MTFRELIENKKVKPSDFKKGDTVKWAGTFGSRVLDKSGKITGFKDHPDYKNGYLIIKGDDKKEYKLIFSAVHKDISESKDFYRLPKKVIENELYVLSGLFNDLYKRNKSGNDFKPYVLDEAEKMIKNIKKAVVKNPSEEEMKKLDEGNKNEF